MPSAVRAAAGRLRPAGGEDGRTGGSSPSPKEPARRRPSAAHTLTTAFPFLFGGGVLLVVSFSLHGSAARPGTPPYWILFLTLGGIALLTGVLLLWVRGPDDEHAPPPTEPPTNEAPSSPETITVSKEAWERLHGELESLRASARRDDGVEGLDGTPSGDDPGPPASGPEPFAREADWDEGPQ